jgi:hypothetical protein
MGTQFFVQVHMEDQSSTERWKFYVVVLI